MAGVILTERPRAGFLPPMPPSAERATKDRQSPRHGEAAEAARAARLAKEAEALRANLGKRKAQSRARKDQAAAPSSEPAG